MKEVNSLSRIEISNKKTMLANVVRELSEAIKVKLHTVTVTGTNQKNCSSRGRFSEGPNRLIFAVAMSGTGTVSVQGRLVAYSYSHPPFAEEITLREQLLEVERRQVGMNSAACVAEALCAPCSL